MRGSENVKFAILNSFALGYLYIKVNVKKGKAVPFQAWGGPEGSRKLRFPDFMTTAQDGGKVVSLTHRPPLPPGNTYIYRVSQEECEILRESVP